MFQNQPFIETGSKIDGWHATRATRLNKDSAKSIEKFSFEIVI